MTLVQLSKPWKVKSISNDTVIARLIFKSGTHKATKLRLLNKLYIEVYKGK
jgi:hypothetical protein